MPYARPRRSAAATLELGQHGLDRERALDVGDRSAMIALPERELAEARERPCTDACVCGGGGQRVVVEAARLLVLAEAGREVGVEERIDGLRRLDSRRQILGADAEGRPTVDVSARLSRHAHNDGRLLAATQAGAAAGIPPRPSLDVRSERGPRGPPKKSALTLAAATTAASVRILRTRPVVSVDGVSAQA